MILRGYVANVSNGQSKMSGNVMRVVVGLLLVFAQIVDNVVFIL